MQDKCLSCLYLLLVLVHGDSVFIMYNQLAQQVILTMIVLPLTQFQVSMSSTEAV